MSFLPVEGGKFRRGGGMLNEEQSQEIYVREGRKQRTEFTIFFNIVFDRYQPIIGDQATLYYLYLLRKRNNQEGHDNYGKAWDGRKGVLEKFRIGPSTLVRIDTLLKAVGLIDIEHKPSGRGKDKIYYVVHDALTKAEFDEKEAEFTGKVMAAIAEDPDIANMVGKEFKRKYFVKASGE
jgi:hypothetical protein